MAEPVLALPPGPVPADNLVAAEAVDLPAEPAKPMEEIEEIALVFPGVLQNMLCTLEFCADGKMWLFLFAKDPC